jgi:pimeloyl-ACP methyl ester carboxylesterase
MLTPAYRQAGDGPETVLYLHGVGGDRTSFDAQIGACGPGFSHIAWDMPGYGDSAALPEMTFPALAGAAVRMLDELGVERAHIVGHSMGGMIAQEIAATHQERIASLVLSATSPAFGKPDGDWQREFLAARLKPLDEGKTPADLAPKVVETLMGPDADGVAKAAAVASMSRITPDAYRAALTCLVGFDRREALADIRVPTLGIAGEHDTTAPPKVVARMADAIANAEYVLLPGVGHLANLENPEAFNAALANFFAAVTT